MSSHTATINHQLQGVLINIIVSEIVSAFKVEDHVSLVQYESEVTWIGLKSLIATQG